MDIRFVYLIIILIVVVAIAVVQQYIVVPVQNYHNDVGKRLCDWCAERGYSGCYYSFSISSAVRSPQFYCQTIDNDTFVRKRAMMFGDSFKFLEVR